MIIPLLTSPRPDKCSIFLNDLRNVSWETLLSAKVENKTADPNRLAFVFGMTLMKRHSCFDSNAISSRLFRSHGWNVIRFLPLIERANLGAFVELRLPVLSSCRIEVALTTICCPKSPIVVRIL